MQIFLTGCTGYIGGEVLYALSRLGKGKFSISCLVRDESKAKQVLAAFPDVKIVEGSLDDLDLIKKQAEAADVVLHLAATGHLPSSKAIVEGLKRRRATTGKAPYWIQMSGATLFAQDEIKESRFGFASDLVLDDVKDREKILSIIRKFPNRSVDNLAIEQSPEDIKTALIVGPLIYGTARGPGNTRSIQAPEIAKATLELGHGFQLSDGENIWSNIHVVDLGKLICNLVEMAADGQEGCWNTDGVLNPAIGEMTFKELNARIAQEAVKQGHLKTSATDLKKIDAARADELSGHASVLWGTNARARSSKGQTSGWKPSSPSLEDDIAEMVRFEAKKAAKQ